MKNATFSHHVRPFPMLLAGAIVSPLVFLASCGSTPDQPEPQPQELVQVEPAPVEVEPDPIELALTAEPTEAEQAEEKVDLQVAGMRAALQDALRASGIDPETLEVEGTEVPADEPAVGLADASETTPIESDDALAALESEPEAVLDSIAEAGAESILAEAQPEPIEPQTVAESTEENDQMGADVDVDVADQNSDELAMVDSVTDTAVEQAKVKPAKAKQAAASDAADQAAAAQEVAEPSAELALDAPQDSVEPHAEVTVAENDLAETAELTLDVQANDGEALVAEELEPEVAALTDAELAKIEAELMLLGMDPGRTGPVEFDDFYTPPVEVATEPEVVDAPAAEDAVLAEGEGVELVLDDELAMNAEPVDAVTLDADPLVVVDASEEAAELAAPLFIEGDDVAQAEDLLQVDEALAPDVIEVTRLAADLAELDKLVAEQNAEDEDLADALDPVAANDADPFAKFGAIQWEVTRIQMPAEVIAEEAAQRNETSGANGAQALDIQKVPVPSVATAVGNDWGAFQFMRSVPVEQRLLLAPLCAIDPSGGLAGISLAFQGINVSTNLVLEGAPQDPAVAGLTYSDGAEFDPVAIEPTASVVNEPGIGMIWWSTELPTSQVHAQSEVQTPSVGRVRIVLNSGDYVEGVMHSAGLGQYKIDGELGRFAVRAKLVSHIERLPKPGLGQQVKGLQAGDLVRAKVKTGYIEGRLISMKDGKALVETATGMRISLGDAEVEPMGQSKTRVVID